MPRLVLTSNAVAYDLYEKLAAAGVRAPSGNARGLLVQLPAATFEAANAGATLKIGEPDSYSNPTDVTKPEVAISENQSVNYPGEFIPLKGKFLKGSVNNQVLYVIVEPA